MNITEGVEFKIKMYKNTDITKYESELNKNSEFADDLGIEMNEYPELPKYYLGCLLYIGFRFHFNHNLFLNMIDTKIN